MPTAIATVRGEFVLVEVDSYMAHDGDLGAFGFELDRRRNRMRARLTVEVEEHLKMSAISYELESCQGAQDIAVLNADDAIDELEGHLGISLR